MATFVPTVTLVRLVFSKNAASPMLVISRPLVVLGMTTAPPGPVYSDMFKEPSLLDVNVNWACDNTGGVSKRKRSNSFAAKHIFVFCVIFIQHTTSVFCENRF